MMNQSAGSEVVGTLAPRCYEKIAKVLSAPHVLSQRAGAMTPVWSNPVRWLLSKNRGTRPFAVGDPKRLAWA